MVFLRIREIAMANLARLSLLCVTMTAAASSIACGGVMYSARITSVESKIENAKEMGAETLAPYEYYSAQQRAIKAREEAARADYGDALELIDEAEVFADKAIAQAGAVRKGAGR